MELLSSKIGNFYQRKDKHGKLFTVTTHLVPILICYEQYHLRKPHQLFDGCYVRAHFCFPLRYSLTRIQTFNDAYKGQSNAILLYHCWALSLFQTFTRMTAKATQFGKRTFTSWLIESSGALPIHRRMDFPETVEPDNSDILNKLYNVSPFLHWIPVKRDPSRCQCVAFIGLGSRRYCVHVSRRNESISTGACTTQNGSGPYHIRSPFSSSRWS